jgi:hypothetical protein
MRSESKRIATTTNSLLKYAEMLPDEGIENLEAIDNLRDKNFYDPSHPNSTASIAEFFSATFPSYTDRNIITINSYNCMIIPETKMDFDQALILF